VALFAYEREREFPLSGGVSVVRRSIPLDHDLSALTTRLLSTIGWHGVAMVEFKYDRRTRRYTLMEINGRFQASTALSIDAGINLPELAMSVHLDRETVPVSIYRNGVMERWLRGDIASLVGTLQPMHANGTGHIARVIAFVDALWPFLRDFGRRSFYDEFRFNDPLPGLEEAGSMLKDVARAMTNAMVRVIRPSRKSVASPDAAVPMPRSVTLEALVDGETSGVVSSAAATRIPASVATQRSMRA
jgi:predicted ATP-grasp superfamily ATP-dependent carboligase